MNWTHLLVNSNSQIEFLKSRDVLLKIMSKYNKKIRNGIYGKQYTIKGIHTKRKNMLCSSININVYF